LIDILQEYDLNKKLEHGIKALYYDGQEISAVKPDKYCSRFISFVSRIVD